MSAQATSPLNKELTPSVWRGGVVPLGSSYGKLMMWLFLLSDAFTFSSLLVVYGYLRTSAETWPDPDVVFNAFPFMGDTNLPLVFVGLMTFILITSSVTMVLAVEAGHRMDKDAVVKYMILTIIGGALFLGCQAWEWTHMITDEPPTTIYQNPYGGPEGTKAGAGSGEVMFGQLFFSITGFHGFHVFSGLIILIIVLINVMRNVYHNRGHYEMVEKVGLYWHFVDLVWVWVFTLFYLI
jgi:cytochrome c oxidase subunit III